ncbi:hypothetical protein [Companilactobacillus furfuricola]|uniref:hypothetical protein n=1 Tax=Companilactobacillus furfuricola TaxID=1462575 RepID=UPI000F78A0C9|nr:hypothetical protein [Companilactobacillus furfuricola]
MDIFQEIDKKKTRKNARDILKKYRRLSRMCEEGLTNYYSKEQISSLFHVKKVQSTQGSISNEAKRELVAIQKALGTLSIENLEVIYFTYLSKEKHSCIEISELVYGGYLSMKTIERRQQEGLVQFCEAYKNGKYLIWLDD